MRLLCLGAIVSSMVIVAGASIQRSTADLILDNTTEDKVVRLDRLSEVEATSLKQIILDKNVPVYVLDKDVFDALDKENVDEYLNYGGSLVVNDNKVDAKKISSTIPLGNTEIDLSKSDDRIIGFNVTQEKDERKVTYFGYTFMDNSESVGKSSNDLTEAVKAETAKGLDIEGMVQEQVDKLLKIHEQKQQEALDVGRKEMQVTGPHVFRDEIEHAFDVNLINSWGGRNDADVLIYTKLTFGNRYFNFDELLVRRSYQIGTFFEVTPLNGLKTKYFSPTIYSEDLFIDAMQYDNKIGHYFTDVLNDNNRPSGFDAVQSHADTTTFTATDSSFNLDVTELSSSIYRRWKANSQYSNGDPYAGRLLPIARIFGRDDTTNSIVLKAHVSLGQMKMVGGDHVNLWNGMELKVNDMPSIEIQVTANDIVAMTPVIGNPINMY